MLSDFYAKTADGEEVPLSRFAGQVVLIVNTASKCGFAPQLGELEDLYEKYKDRGFTVLAFPCSQFLNQEHDDDRVVQGYCRMAYDVTYPLFGKIDVNGEHEHPLYTWLKEEKKGMFGKDIRWNFTKFLLNREGIPVERFAPMVKPKKIESAIRSLLREEEEVREPVTVSGTGKGS